MGAKAYGKIAVIEESLANPKFCAYPWQVGALLKPFKPVTVF
jgi:hypothetical protein